MWFGRRWCPVGHRPPFIYDEKYQWLWLYAAIEPVTGRSFFALMPAVDADCFRSYLDAFSEQLGPGRAALTLDNAGSHHAKGVWPENIEPIFLPAYSPELNPVEAVFKELKKALSNRIFEDLDQLEEAIGEQLRKWWDNPQLLVRLTAYPWWKESVEYIRTSQP